MTIVASEPEFGEPDDESPEWTDEDTRWAVRAWDFPNHAAAHAFLVRREGFFDIAEAAGISREAFMALEPSKPGFEERASVVLDKLLKFTQHSAE